jgi:ParB family chromosome partitioning protein
MSSSKRKKITGKHTSLSNHRQDDGPIVILDDLKNGEFKIIPIDSISPDPKQPRQIFNDKSLAELSESIKQKGVLQPVIVRINGDNKFRLVAGERRYRAAKLAGLKNIPGIITSDNPAEISLIENIQREDLKPVEEAEAYNRMIKEYGYTQEKLAKVIGKARTTVTESLTLNKLPDELKKKCRTSDISKSVLLEIAKQKNKKAMYSLYEVVKNGGLKTREIREITRAPRTKRTQTAIAIERIKNLSDTIARLNFKSSPADPSEKAEERIQFLTMLENLRQQIDSIL